MRALEHPSHHLEHEHVQLSRHFDQRAKRRIPCNKWSQLRRNKTYKGDGGRKVGIGSHRTALDRRWTSYTLQTPLIDQPDLRKKAVPPIHMFRRRPEQQLGGGIRFGDIQEEMPLM